MDRTLDSETIGVIFVTIVVVSALFVPIVATAEITEARATGSLSGPESASQSGANACTGTITDRPNGTTLLSIQGARGSEKTDAMLVGIRPNGEVIGVSNGDARDRWWYYDVDPLANGNVLLSTTEPGISVVDEIDPTTGEQVSERRFPDVLDSHDADLINEDELLVNDMSQNGDDRIFVYNLSSDEIVWEYRFADHPDAFPHDGGGEYGEDWTHNNDVEQIRPGVFMVSVRNFDQVVAIERETKEIRWTLGEDDNHSILFEQHNPDYLRGENGTPTVLVADSRNDRVIEYARDNGSWTQQWVLRGGGLNEPRDADRLPNGNTLVSDRRGHRLLEVTPTGAVVWEFYAPWQPYDAERLGTGDESSGPTARQSGATGVHEMTGSSGVNESRTEACYAFLTSWSGGAQLIPNEQQPTQSTTEETQSQTQQTGDSAMGPPPSRFPSSAVIGGFVVALLGVALLLFMKRR